jgi:hypothetical protein
MNYLILKKIELLNVWSVYKNNKALLSFYKNHVHRLNNNSIKMSTVSPLDQKNDEKEIWTCQQCSLDNKNSDEKCTMCGYDSSNHNSPRECFIVCIACTFEYDIKNQTCPVCNTRHLSNIPNPSITDKKFAQFLKEMIRHVGEILYRDMEDWGNSTHGQNLEMWQKTDEYQEVFNNQISAHREEINAIFYANSLMANCDEVMRDIEWITNRFFQIITLIKQRLSEVYIRPDEQLRDFIASTLQDTEFKSIPAEKKVMSHFGKELSDKKYGPEETCAFCQYPITDLNDDDATDSKKDDSIVAVVASPCCSSFFHGTCAYEGLQHSPKCPCCKKVITHMHEAKAKDKAESGMIPESEQAELDIDVE